METGPAVAAYSTASLMLGLLRTLKQKGVLNDGDLTNVFDYALAYLEHAQKAAASEQEEAIVDEARIMVEALLSRKAP